MNGHKAKKSFGQNFLVDQNIIADIIRAIRPEADDNMVEIGPGLGALTRPLLKLLNTLHVVEIDRDIIARLKTDYPQDKIVIHEGDALKFDFADFRPRCASLATCRTTSRRRCCFIFPTTLHASPTCISCSRTRWWNAWLPRPPHPNMVDYR